VAAAAHSDAFDTALMDANANLSMLRNQCGLPSELEVNIGRFWYTLNATSRSVQRLQDTCTAALRQAIGTQFRKVEFAADAFREYVQRRHLREDDAYLIQRANVAGWLIEVIDETISYFATLK
jgi:hypothetical protein